MADDLLETIPTDGIERPLDAPLLDVRDLHVEFKTDEGTLKAVDGVSFTVDRPGTPVLVKQSYFPNWEVSGADGPYRVAPNLMVVVPTDTEVSLTFGRSGIDLLALGLSLLGIGLVVVLARAGAVAVPRLRDPD